MNTYTKIGYLLRCARLSRQLSTVLNKKANFYELLGVSPKATAAEIKNAYFEKTKLYHPDVAASTDESVTMFRQISEAYEVLGSPTLRKEYDRDVLGIQSEDEQDSEDPISLYRRKMANETSSWTKEHYSTLRKQQYVYNSPLPKKPMHTSVSAENYYKYILIFLALCLISIKGSNIDHYRKEKM